MGPRLAARSTIPLRNTWPQAHCERDTGEDLWAKNLGRICVVLGPGKAIRLAENKARERGLHPHFLIREASSFNFTTSPL